MMEMEIINLTPDNIADYGVCGYKNVKKHLELRSKIAWFKEYYPKGLRIKALVLKDGGYQGMLEYIPGKYAHRPVNAAGYSFIHCIFVGFKKEFKGQGHASALLAECLSEAQAQKMLGLAVVTRKGSFMADKKLFLKLGFSIVDSAKPDFELLALKFNPESPDPQFKTLKKPKYPQGLTVLRSAQCPYSEKNVMAILKTAKSKFRLNVTLIDLLDADAAQQTPCAFGTFCILYNGEVISHHPISNGRFENIMRKLLI